MESVVQALRQAEEFRRALDDQPARIDAGPASVRDERRQHLRDAATPRRRADVPEDSPGHSAASGGAGVLGLPEPILTDERPIPLHRLRRDLDRLQLCHDRLHAGGHALAFVGCRWPVDGEAGHLPSFDSSERLTIQSMPSCTSTLARQVSIREPKVTAWTPDGVRPTLPSKFRPTYLVALGTGRSASWRASVPTCGNMTPTCMLAACSWRLECSCTAQVTWAVTHVGLCLMRAVVAPLG